MKGFFFIILLYIFSAMLLAQKSDINFNIDTLLIENTDWFKFYKKQNQNLTLKDFSQSDFQSEFETIQGNIIPDYDPKFPNCNKKFIIESPDQMKYLDFLSYSALQDEQDSCKIIGFEVDQEVNLVDRVNKTVKRLGFYGANESVEDAMWIDNDKLLLFRKRNDEKNKSQLFIEFYNLKTKVHFVFFEKNYYAYNKSFKATYLK